VSYAAKIEKSEAALNWHLPADDLDRQVRAFNPFPGASIVVNGMTIKIWKATAESGSGEPGAVLSSGKNGIVVACGEGTLRLSELQKAGGKRLPVERFLAGTGIPVGARFALAP
jgi:methionyl-tRNA formyltransferase